MACTLGPFSLGEPPKKHQLPNFILLQFPSNGLGNHCSFTKFTPNKRQNKSILDYFKHRRISIFWNGLRFNICAASSSSIIPPPIKVTISDFQGNTHFHARPTSKQLHFVLLQKV